MENGKQHQEIEPKSQSIFDEKNGDTNQNNAQPQHKPPRWRKVVVVLVLVFIVALVIVVKEQRRKSSEPTRGELVKTFSPEEVIATVNMEEITLAELGETLEQLPDRYRKTFERRKHDFLEELITRTLILQEADRLKINETEEYKQAIAADNTRTGHEEEVLINVLIQKEILAGIEVSDADLQEFYEQHKAELAGQPRFEDIKETLRSSALQQKQYQKMAEYLAKLKESAEITRNAVWIEAQQTIASDNPLDRALSTGRPVLADFGRGVCTPCKMMKPILEGLAEKYRGKAEILIIEMDEYPTLARRSGIRLIPTQIFYDSAGNEVYRHEGFMSKKDVEKQLSKLGVK